MATSVYSWVLSEIRKGRGQVESYNRAIAKFVGENRNKIYNQWLTAWAGKYTADRWAASPNDPLRVFLENKPLSNDLPDINASRDVIQSWFSAVGDTPYDFNTLYKITSGATSQFGQWRYEANNNDTYTMAIASAEGTLIKEYLRKGRGEIEFLRHWFIASAIRPV